MSEQVTYVGVLKPIIVPEDKTLEQVCEEIILEHNLDYYSHLDSWLEKILDSKWYDVSDKEDPHQGHRYFYSQSWGQLFKVEAKRAVGEYFCEIYTGMDSWHTGDLHFATTFYNGSTSLEEMLEEKLVDWKRRLDKN